MVIATYIVDIHIHCFAQTLDIHKCTLCVDTKRAGKNQLLLYRTLALTTGESLHDMYIFVLGSRILKCTQLITIEYDAFGACPGPNILIRIVVKWLTYRDRPSWCDAVGFFQPKYRLGCPKEYLLSLSL